jgi:phenylalanyl-tRNA synthetase beta chain
MGGEESEISEASKTILLESAYFSPASIRGTAKALGMRTEASYRFERGADPEMPVQALNLASRLICQLAGGRCVSPVIDEHPRPRRPVELQLRFERIRRILGMDVDRVDVEAILGHLGFLVQTKQEESLVVAVPSFRVDVGIEDDLVEEVGRHVGYDRIPSAYPPASLPGRQDPTLSHQQAICAVLNGLGFYEAIQYAFSQPEREQPFRTGTEDSPPIANPLSETDTHLRTTLIPGLLESVRRNLHHGTKDVRLFEIGKVYRGIGNPLEGVAEEPRLGLVATGQFHQSYWDSARMDFHFFHFKGVLEALFSRLKMQVDFARCELPFLHPGASALVKAGKEALGSVGELHPQLQDRLKCPSPVFLAEISLSNVFARRLPEPVYRPLVRFPSIDRDFSFVIDKDFEFSKIRSAVQTLKIEDLQDLRVIDIYQGSHLPPEKISLTVRLTFANPERTLTQQEVSDSAGRVVDELRREFGVEQRS